MEAQDFETSGRKSYRESYKWLARNGKPRALDLCERDLFSSRNFWQHKGPERSLKVGDIGDLKEIKIFNRLGKPRTENKLIGVLWLKKKGVQTYTISAWMLCKGYTELGFTGFISSSLVAGMQ